MADSYLTQEEKKLREDAVKLIWITRRNDTIIDVIVCLEEALEENEALRQRIAELESGLGRPLASPTSSFIEFRAKPRLDGLAKGLDDSMEKE